MLDVHHVLFQEMVDLHKQVYLQLELVKTFMLLMQQLPTVLRK